MAETVTLWVETDWCTDNGLNGANVYLTEAEAEDAVDSQAATHEEHGCEYEQVGPFSVQLSAVGLLDLAASALGWVLPRCFRCRGVMIPSQEFTGCNVCLNRSCTHYKSPTFRVAQ